MSFLMETNSKENGSKGLGLNKDIDANSYFQSEIDSNGNHLASGSRDLDTCQSVTQHSYSQGAISTLRRDEELRIERAHKAKQDIDAALGSMENLLWWSSNEKEKATWSQLIAKLRQSTLELNSELLEASEESTASKTRLWNTLVDINDFKIRLLSHQISETARVAPWVSDGERDVCVKCKRKFLWLIRGKHHCRACGEVFCDPCCNKMAPVPKWGYMSPVRVCDFCDELLASRRAKAANSQIVDGSIESMSSDLTFTNGNKLADTDP